MTKKSKKAATVFEMPVIASEAMTVDVATELVATEPPAATKKHGGRKADALPTTPAEPEPAETPPAAPAGSLTMASLAERYIAALRDAGKGLGTQFSLSLIHI